MRRSVENPLRSFRSGPAVRLAVGPVEKVAASVLATVVCHDPRHEALSRLVGLLVRQPGVHVLLVDNSELASGRTATASVASAFGVDLIVNRVNLGVAAAHNVGIRHAFERNVDYVLLLDQDSALADGGVAHLAAAHRALTKAGQPAAAVGPAIVDFRCDAILPFARLRRLRMEAVMPGPGEAAECDILISSGCLISVEALRKVGGMDEPLFIDFVDFEWCLRARSAGWKVFGVADAHLHHGVGDRAFVMLGRVIPVHVPARNYYLTRNALLLAGKPYLTWRWRAHLTYRVIGQALLFVLLCPGRLQRLGWVLRGLFDGVLRRGGRLGAVGWMERPNRARRDIEVPVRALTSAADRRAVVPARDSAPLC